MIHKGRYDAQPNMVLEIKSRIDAFENGRGFSLKVEARRPLRDGKDD